MALDLAKALKFIHFDASPGYHAIPGQHCEAYRFEFYGTFSHIKCVVSLKLYYKAQTVFKIARCMS